MDEKIRQQDGFLNSVIESLNHPFFVIDADNYRIKLANSATGLYGQLSENSTCYEITHKSATPCDGSEHVCPLRKVKQTKKPAVVEHIHTDKDGNLKNSEIHAHPITDRNGNVVEIIEYILDITDRKQAEKSLKQTHEQLIVEQLKLRNKDIALKEVLNQIKEEEFLIKGNIQKNIDRIIAPLLEKLKATASPAEKKYVDLLEASLSNITSPFISNLETDYSGLSPRELEVCNMIRRGLSSKDIASILNTSVHTVHTQRRNIRKKLRIKGKSNLSSFLQHK